MIQRVLGGLTALLTNQWSAGLFQFVFLAGGLPLRLHIRFRVFGCNSPQSGGCRQPVGRKGDMPVRRTSTGYAYVQCPRRR